ncbi:MAG: hypothetical protein PWQ37_2064 [Candidatus Petromonas sp.]|jgi:hypothetical protein|nr:hypothetical protein [Candidatus Petromonas sp.]
MSIFKTAIKIIFLITLCIPIVYIQYYMLKDTVKSVMKPREKKPVTMIYNRTEKYRKKYLEAAK